MDFFIILRHLTTAPLEGGFIATNDAEGLELAPAENPRPGRIQWVKTLRPGSLKSGKYQA